MSPNQKQLGLIVAAVVIVTAAYFVGGKYLKNQGETQGWETYRNEQYGFEIKYPNPTYKAGSDIAVPGSLITFAGGVDYSNSSILSLMSLNMSDSPRGETNRDIVEKHFDLAALEKKLGVKVTSRFEGDPPWSWYYISIPLKSNPNKYVTFTIRIDHQDDPVYGGTYQYTESASEIFSTFKFLK